MQFTTGRLIVGLTSLFAGGMVLLITVFEGHVNALMSIGIAIVTVPLWAMGTSLTVRTHNALRAWAHGGQVKPLPLADGRADNDPGGLWVLFGFTWPIILVGSLLYYTAVAVAFRVGVK